jgi:hypothetical protein
MSLVHLGRCRHFAFQDTEFLEQLDPEFQAGGLEFLETNFSHFFFEF